MSDFTGFIRTSWKFLGNARLSVWLIYAIFTDILAGSIIMKHHPVIFFALKDLKLQRWLATYGLKNFYVTSWFFLAIFLFFLLGLTTFVCSTNNVVNIIARFQKGGIWVCIKKLSPSIIHFGFLLLLLGQLVSHTMGINSHGNIMTPNGTIKLPESEIQISLNQLNIKFFKKGTRFIGMEERAKNCSAILSIADSNDVYIKKISINRPCRYGKWTFFIEDFYPRIKGVKRPPFINLILRKDPGIRLMKAGAMIFGLGLVIYLWPATKTFI